MPNHVTNIIKFKNELKDKIVNKDGFVDFNLCVPMPQHSDTFYAKGSIGAEVWDKYGKNNWLDWCISNWGTKWNAYEQSVWLDDEVCTATFCTAWCYPHCWADELADYGDFVLLYADEDFGSYNCGIIKCIDGELHKEQCFSEVDGLALSFYVKGYDPYDYAGFVTENGHEVDATLAEACANYKEILNRILPDGFDVE